jgi:glutathione synthase/RimK-type ligase-like ATP-grasp enzyme
VILVAGIPSEPPLQEALDALHDLRADVLVLSQRQGAETDIAFSVDPAGAVDGVLRAGRRHVALREISAVYARLMDHRHIPEYQRLEPDDPERDRWAVLSDQLTAWLDVAPTRVVNRTSAMASNGSKPYQAQLISRHGLLTPETLITNDPHQAREFYETRSRVVYKSASGARSIVQTMVSADVERLGSLRACPVQFQTWVPGTDVRVHVVGNEVFATAITTTATDYRYATAQVDEPAHLEAYELDDEVAERCRELTADLRLEFAGIDLKITPDGEVYCFEVNPSPAYTYFSGQTKQPIAQALARHLRAA